MRLILIKFINSFNRILNNLLEVLIRALISTVANLEDKPLGGIHNFSDIAFALMADSNNLSGIID